MKLGRAKFRKHAGCFRVTEQGAHGRWRKKRRRVGEMEGRRKAEGKNQKAPRLGSLRAKWPWPTLETSVGNEPA